MDTQKTVDNMNSNQEVAVAPPVGSQNSSVRLGGGLKGIILLSALIVSIALIAAAALGAWMVNRSDNTTVGYQGIDTARYQSVFLTNGQVYFGKLSDNGSELVKLTDIWYLQVQQGSQSTSAEALKDSSQSQVSLAKLGNELHGPDDSMSISKDQVLFWENLKNDSKVVKTIKEAK